MKDSKNNKKSFSRSLQLGVCGLLFALLLLSCSTQKNTSGTRFYHAFTARFNTLHNAQMAMKEGVEAQNRTHKDDFTDLLPMYISTNKRTSGIGKSSYETTIEKCEKAIKTHSIKKRPTIKGNKRRTPKQKEFLARKEYNPYLYRAWLMMADAQFQKGEFIEAASTLNYILRLYSTQPDITSVAKARLARCYVALEWAYDAEDILTKLQRDSMTLKGEQECDNTTAAYLILTGQHKEAIPYVEKSIKHTKGKLPKARMYFLLGQLYQETGDGQMAYKAYGKVIKKSPPYEMALNARILQTEVISHDKYKQMIARLKRMAKSDKNKNYLDKVYYAIGNIHLSIQDTTSCISAYERGAKESTQNGIDKAMLLLRLSQIYWERENYIDAARTYKDCIAILEKDHEEYKESERRSKILTKLEPHLNAIKLQDSLQALAKMDEKGYLAAIDREIAALKAKEKEEEKLAAKKGLSAATKGDSNAQGTNTQPTQRTTTTSAGGGQKGAWYFYNPTTVSKGKQEFQKRWGQRKNEDFWRISQRSSLIGEEAEEENLDEAKSDSLFGVASEEEELLTEEEKARRDSLANDPHEREYYLKQIPFTEEMMEASNQILCNGLYNAGILCQEELENFPLAERTMKRFIANFPEHEKMDNIYYHLFLLYGRLGRNEEAELYRQLLLEKYPESKLSTLLGNPNYDMISRNGPHIEDSLYQASYAAYQTSDYAQVESIYQYSTENFPEGKNRARLLFIRAMSQLYSGQRDSFMVSLEEVIRKHPKEEITELAKSIEKGLKDGKLLADERYDASNIWSRRLDRTKNDSTGAAPVLKDERYSNFAFVLAYPTNSLDEDQLLYEMARYNFTSYMVRNFEIEITENEGLSMMAIKGFLSYDEVHSYAQHLYADNHMSQVLKGLRSLLISEDNLKLIGSEFSFDDYKNFYDEKFAPLEVPKDLQIDEPNDLEIIDPDNLDSEEKEEEEENTTDDSDDFDDFFF